MPITGQSAREGVDRLACDVHHIRPSAARWQAGLEDSVLPGCQRRLLAVIGPNAAWDGASPAPLLAAEHFCVGVIEVEPGGGTALHTHETAEVLYAVSGTWRVSWGDRGEHDVVIEPRQLLDIPSGVMRAFTNCGDEQGLLVVVNGGADGGGLRWDDGLRGRIDAVHANGPAA